MSPSGTGKLRWRDRLLLSAEDNKLLSQPVFQSLRAANTLRTSSPRLFDCLRQRRLPEPEELRALFESMGVTYIKLGQFIGSSPSLFPKDYVRAFQDCFDQVPALDFSVIRAVIEQELDASVESLYDWVDDKPLASASIAQVHAARLKSGESVVIKVQKPGVASTIKADLSVMLWVTRLLEWITPNVNKSMLSGFVEAIYPYMVDECNFSREAQYLIEFDRFLKESSNTDVVVPRPFVELSSERVLTMERLYGQSYSDLLRQHKPEELLQDQALAAGIAAAKRTWFESLTANWFFHADLHLGNLMHLESGQVGFIDFGLVGSVSKTIWQSSIQLFQGVLQGEAEVIAESLVNIGMTNRTVDIAQFAHDIQELLSRFESLQRGAPADLTMLGNSGTTVEEEALMADVNGWMIELASLSRDYGIVFPHAFTLLLKQFLYFDRLADMAPTDMSLIDEVDEILSQVH